MDPKKQREIASKGGRASHAKGTGYEFTSDEARIAGRKGGRASQKNRNRKDDTDDPPLRQHASRRGDITVESSFPSIIGHDRRKLDRDGSAEFLGESLAANAVRRRIELIAESDKHILITGETGTGKTFVARIIHDLSRRHLRPYCSVNCAAVPEALIESELFGHKRGSFTDAIRDRAGYFKIADGGTIFLDEVGEASAGLQAKLLRVLDSGSFTPVGSDIELSTDVRVIASTNVDLSDALRSHKFRRDLYYRLYGLSLHMTPLRDRLDDLPILVQHYSDSNSTGAPIQFAEDAMCKLRQHTWPGNVRELFAVIENALLLARAVHAASISAEHVEFPLW